MHTVRSGAWVETRSSGSQSEKLLHQLAFGLSSMCERPRPGPAPVTARTEKANELSQLAGVDLEEILGAGGTRHTLNTLGAATRYRVCVWALSKSRHALAQVLIGHWARPLGAPGMIIHGQGGDLFKHCQGTLRNLGVQPRMSATETPLQDCLVEQHGQALGKALPATVSAIFAAVTKSRRADASGHNARARPFGVRERSPKSAGDTLQEEGAPVEADDR